MGNATNMETIFDKYEKSRRYYNSRQCSQGSTVNEFTFFDTVLKNQNLKRVSFRLLTSDWCRAINYFYWTVHLL